MRFRLLYIPLLSVAVLSVLFANFISNDAPDSQERIKQYGCEATSILDSNGCRFVVYEGLNLDVCKRIPFLNHCPLVEAKNEQECKRLYEHYKSIEVETISYVEYRFARCWEHHDFFASSNPNTDYDWFDSEEERCSARYNHTQPLLSGPDVRMLPYEHYRLKICELGQTKE